MGIGWRVICETGSLWTSGFAMVWGRFIFQETGFGKNLTYDLVPINPCQAKIFKLPWNLFMVAAHSDFMIAMSSRISFSVYFRLPLFSLSHQFFLWDGVGGRETTREYLHSVILESSYRNGIEQFGQRGSEMHMLKLVSPVRKIIGFRIG